MKRVAGGIHWVWVPTALFMVIAYGLQHGFLTAAIPAVAGLVLGIVLMLRARARRNDPSDPQDRSPHV